MARKMALKGGKNRTLGISVLFLAAFNILVWYGVLASEGSVLAEQENIGVPARTEVSVTAGDVAAVKEVLAIGEPMAASEQSPGAVQDVSGAAGSTAEDVVVPDATEGIGEPARLKIPSIAVDATVEKVALAADGSMDVPKHYRNTAWYSLGPRPGETGSATITGHVDTAYGTAAVFANLHKVKSGDTISVQNDDDTVVRFVVRKTRRYDATADATDVFVSNDGKAHLNVITCVGAWDNRAKQYAERLVVFADKETE